MKTRARKTSSPSKKLSAKKSVPVPRDGRNRRPMQRIYEIHARICSGALPNCSTLSQTLEVDRKTIQRDISFMRDSLGLPLVYCDDLHGYRYDGDVSDFPVFEISAKELATLFFTRNALHGIRDTRLAEALSATFAKTSDSSKTRAMKDAYQQPQRELDEFTRALPCTNGQCGLLAVVGDRVEGIDVLSRPEAYAHSRQLKQEIAISLSARRVLRSDFTEGGSGDSITVHQRLEWQRALVFPCGGDDGFGPLSCGQLGKTPPAMQSPTSRSSGLYPGGPGG